MRPLRLPPAVRIAVTAHAAREAPHECCGFLLGVGNRVAYALPATNVSRRPLVRFEVDPREHVALQRMLRRLVPRLSIVGVYHSHPSGPTGPSASDVKEAAVREWAHLIVDLQRRTPRLSAWMIRDGRARKRPLAR
jgi:proteasome lid subunit RPN8/RPN11